MGGILREFIWFAHAHFKLPLIACDSLDKYCCKFGGNYGYLVQLFSIMTGIAPVGTQLVHLEFISKLKVETSKQKYNRRAL